MPASPKKGRRFGGDAAHQKAMFLQLNRAMRFGTPNIKNCGVGYSVIWSDLCYPDY